MEKEIEVGRVVDYFAEAGVAAIVAEKEGIHLGDVLRVKGHTTDIILEVTSMQVDHEDIRQVTKGMTVGIKMNERVRMHDKVYKIIFP